MLLTFQTAPRAGERPTGTTVLMVLGETAHLTVPRDDYLISGLVFEQPAELGDTPVLHGIGQVRRYVASTATDLITLTTTRPTSELVAKAGLRKSHRTLYHWSTGQPIV